MSLVPPTRRLPALLVAALGAVACGGDGRTPLLLYSPHGRDLLLLAEEGFEASHPEVDVRWLDMGSQEVYDRVRSERSNPQADVWFGGPDAILARGADEGLLAPCRPSWADSVPPGSRDPAGRFFGLYRTPAVLVYNDAALPPEEAPRDWDDLLAERFRDQILIRDPLASGTMRSVFEMIVARAVAAGGTVDDGLAWLRRLDAQTKEYTANPALLHAKLQRQEGLVTIWDITDVLIQRQRGAPFGWVFPVSGTAVIDDSIGVVAGAPHGELACAFVEWAGGIEAQLAAVERAYRLPARTDLPAERLPEWLLEVEAELVEAPVDPALVAAQGADWMRRWDREVRGRGVAPEPD